MAGSIFLVFCCITLQESYAVRVRRAMRSKTLKHGDTVYIQNIFGSKPYLDTLMPECEGNVYCVSAASTPTRSLELDSSTGSSGAWQLWRVSGAGSLNHGDEVYIQNAYGVQAFLDTREFGCEGNVYCVSAASTPTRDTSSGSSGGWKIWRVSGAGVVKSGDKVYIQNVYGSQPYLDTREPGCEGNVYCVSTASTYSRDSDSVGTSGTWMLILPEASTQPQQALSHHIVQVSLTPASLCENLGKFSHDPFETPMMHEDVSSQRGIFFLCRIEGQSSYLEVCFFKVGFEDLQICKLAKFYKEYRPPVLEEDGTFYVPIKNLGRVSAIKGKWSGDRLENSQIIFEDGLESADPKLSETIFVKTS